MRQYVDTKFEEHIVEYGVRFFLGKTEQTNRHLFINIYKIGNIYKVNFGIIKCEFAGKCSYSVLCFLIENNLFMYDIDITC